MTLYGVLEQSFTMIIKNCGQLLDTVKNGDNAESIRILYLITKVFYATN
jgi:hypothetical protein